MPFLKEFLRLTLPSLVCCILLGEIFFSFVVPASHQPWGYYDPVDQMYRFEIGQRTGVYTIGKFAEQRGRWRINNAGWNSAVDYFPRNQRQKPLIALIGDSYIEAFQVNIEDSMAGRLREKLKNHFDVYEFGRSGAPLSQYLHMSRYVIEHYEPDILIVNVIHNDFDQSLRNKNPVPFFLELETTGSEISEASLLGSEVTANTLTKLAFRSAILRYVWSNLKYGELWKKPPQIIRAQGQVEAKVEPTNGAGGSVQPSADIYKATDYIVSRMKEETAGRELVFIIDALRSDIYNDTLESSRTSWMNDLLREVCERYDVKLIDLTKPFLARYQASKVKFNSEYDGHWNEEGHRFAAEVLHAALVNFGIVNDVR